MSVTDNKLWTETEDMLKDSKKEIKILKDNMENGKCTIDKLQITTKSALGSVLFHTSGIIVDNWIRIFGHEGDENCGIISFNLMESSNVPQRVDKMLIVAHDVVGGLFAMNTGNFSSGMGKIWYFAPDTLEWENLEFQYSEFLAWCVQGNVDDFYSSMRWMDWRKLAKQATFTEGILIYPFLWSREIQIEKADKKIVPFTELYNLNEEYRQKFSS